jgi:hypothetical protein
MAKKSSSSSNEEQLAEPATTAEDVVAVATTEDLKDLGFATEIVSVNLEGWWAPKTSGEVLVGKLQSTLILDNTDDDGVRQKRLVYLVELSRPCNASHIGDDREEGVLPARSIVAVGEKHQLKVLRQYVTNRARIVITYKGVRPHPSRRGRKLTDFDVQVEKGAIAAPLVLHHETTNDTGDDLPF